MTQQTPPNHPHSVELDPQDMQCLGICVRDLVARLDAGTRTTSEAVLFRETIEEAVHILMHRQQSRAALKAFRGHTLPLYPPISMEELAEHILIRSEEQARSVREMRSRLRFALALDDTCAEAWLLQGDREQRQGQDQQALKSYQQAMHLAAQKLGAEAFDAASRQQIHFWYSTRTRPYMQARAAVASLLWRTQGKHHEATDHFRALLNLNPDDHQGNRYAIICCLLEDGNDEALGGALQRSFLRRDEDGETMDLRETCWWYTQACWQFRCTSSAQEPPSLQAASKALRTAFACNPHVPFFLVHPTALADFGEPKSYSHGTDSEAAWYAHLALTAWQHTPGALEWLEATARRAGVRVE